MDSQDGLDEAMGEKAGDDGDEGENYEAEQKHVEGELVLAGSENAEGHGSAHDRQRRTVGPAEGDRFVGGCNAG